MSDTPRTDAVLVAAAAEYLTDGENAAYGPEEWAAYFEEVCSKLPHVARNLERQNAELLEALKQADAQMEMAANCIELGRYDEALLHARSLRRSRVDAIQKAKS